MLTVKDYIEALQSKGRYHFTTEDAVMAMEQSPIAVRAALRRLKQNRKLATPYRSFHVIVPPEYRQLGCLPAEQFIPQLMDFLKEPYYVGLLSSAVYYGAAHQRPQIFQVMVQHPKRSLRCQRVRVDFFSRRDVSSTPVMEVNTPRGYLRVASAETTILELIGYVEHCGGLDNVANILSEMVESIDPRMLRVEASRVPLSWVQRLGYLLCFVGAEDVAFVLESIVNEHSPYMVPLVPSLPTVGSFRDQRWKVAVNTQVEPDV